jgi:DNA-binding response OmpR family regulator
MKMRNSLYFHRQQIESGGISQDDAVVPDFIAEKFISGSEINVRYLTLNDDSRADRLRWLSQTVSGFQVEQYSEKSTAFMSSHNGNYDALIIGGKDEARITRIIRHNLPLLQTKMKLCLTAKSTARGRAQLIAAGFDDAIDIGRVDPREGIMRIRAIWRRYADWYGRQEGERLYLARLEQIIAVDELSDREGKLIACLELNPGRVVPHGRLRGLISHDWEEVTQKHLKVVISSLRRKLLPGVTISAVRGEGYRLNLPPELRPSPPPTTEEA